MGEAAGGQHHAGARAHGDASGARLQQRAGHPSFALRERQRLRGDKDRDPPPQQRVVEASDQRVAHHQPGATVEAKAVGAVASEESQAVAQGGKRSPGVEEMGDVRAVDHHPAKKHEFGQRWAQLGEVVRQNGGVEWHRLQHAPRQCGSLQGRPVIRVMRVGAQSERTVVFQERHHLGRCVEEGARSCLVETIAENGPQIAQSVVGAVAAGRAVARVGHPQRAGRAGTRATHALGLLDQQHIETEYGCGERSRHPGSAAAEHKKVNLPLVAHHGRCAQLIQDTLSSPD